MTSPMTMLALGRGSKAVDAAWYRSGRVSEIIRFDKAAPSGMRFGKRVFGIAIDSLALAGKARRSSQNREFLCANPWIAVALRAVGIADFSVTGLYAVPGTKSWALLRRALGDAPVVTTAEVEAEQWRSAGGHAVSVLYGNTFGYPTATRTSPIPTIFIGGTSDRDIELTDRLVEAVRNDEHPVKLLIADGSGARSWKGGQAEVTYFDRVSSPEFGKIMSTADVVFLPILDKPRASGHMVCVGALECGLPVVSTVCAGMGGYVDGEFVSFLDAESDLLLQLLKSATTSRSTSDTIEFWRENFSLDAYISRVVNAIDQLSVVDVN